MSRAQGRWSRRFPTRKSVIVCALTLAGCTPNVAPPQPELDGYASFIEESGRRVVIAFGGRYAHERCEGGRERLLAGRKPGSGVTMSDECQAIRLTSATASTADAWVAIGQVHGGLVVLGASTESLCQYVRQRVHWQGRLDLSELTCRPVKLERR
jgi:hypothetical protein